MGGEHGCHVISCRALIGWSPGGPGLHVGSEGGVAAERRHAHPRPGQRAQHQGVPRQRRASVLVQQNRGYLQYRRYKMEILDLQTNLRENFTITEKREGPNYRT